MPVVFYLSAMQGLGLFICSFGNLCHGDGPDDDIDDYNDNDNKTMTMIMIVINRITIIVIVVVTKHIAN